ncbi:ABC transporter permease [Georgenia yuyongxinii]|uniref:Iron ABC transporter permease n=1 Tax=Georgenia yuyongxinii TaxID=2589797 RepID=A0A552WTE7_9MICO|nr:iron ABC transporter permease [Georgenia yuyongxinii]TRW46118.1 iron ABC transporter permease [Georgenia yuyongxinii]
MPGIVAAAVALLPIGYLFVRAGEAGAAEVWEILWRDRTLWLVLRSLGLAAAVTSACVVIGVTLAWLTTRTDLPGRRVWGVVAALPLAVPSFVAAYAWISVVPSLAGFWGTFLVLTACSYPYVYLPVAAALRRVDPALEEVSRSLGRSALRTYLTVTARQVRPAAAAGALLVALYALSDFGTPSLMRYDVFTRVIHTSYRASFDRTPAAVLSLVLVVLTIAITVAEARSRGRAGAARVGGGAARVPPTAPLGRARPLALVGTTAVAAVSLGYPAVVLTYWMARGNSAGLEWERLLPAGASTLWVALLGALAATALAVPVGVLAARHHGRAVRTIEHTTYAGHALPGIVVALALVFFGVRWAEPIYQRTPLLVLAYAVLFMPAAIGSVRAAVAQSPPRLEEVARSLGHAPGAVLRRVTLPLAGPGIAAGFALVTLTVMKELPATLLLRPTGMDTLATRLWTETGVGAYAAAAPYAVALVLLAAVPTFLLTRAQARLVAPRRTGTAMENGHVLEETGGD